MNAVSSYAPRQGSTADLALQQLRAHGPMHRDVLAAAIDKPADEIRALMGYAINLGLIAVEARDDGSWFRLGDGKPVTNARLAQGTASADGSQKPNGAQAIIPAPKLAETTPEGPLTAVQTRVQVEATEACSGAGAVKPERTGPALTPKPNASKPAAKMDTAELRIALWSDGTLQIQRDADDLVLFTRNEARQLVAYLDSIALDVVRGEAA